MPEAKTKMMVYDFHTVGTAAVCYGPNRNLLNPDDVKKTVTSLLKSGQRAEHTKAWAKSTLYTWLCRKYKRVYPVVLHSQMRKLWSVLSGVITPDEVYLLDDAAAPEWLLTKYKDPDPEAVWWYRGLSQAHADQIRHVLDYVDTLTERQYRATVEDCVEHVILWDRFLERQKLAADLVVGCTLVWGDSKTEGALYVVSLDTSGALRAEGQAMKHCVGGNGYARSVREGVTKIFSLRRTGTMTPVATIEVRIRQNLRSKGRSKSQAIVVQIKGPCNHDVKDADAIAVLDKLFFVEVCPLFDATVHNYVPRPEVSYGAMIAAQGCRDYDVADEEDEEDDEENEDEVTEENNAEGAGEDGDVDDESDQWA